MTTSHTQDQTRTPRRSPTADERRRDADASRRQLLAAALDEFAEKGFAGARVSAIAQRAGVNKQLISYYFNGKEGLYRGLQELWSRREADFSRPDLPLDELAVRYLHDALSEPRMTRLLLWRGLSSDTDDTEQTPKNDAKHHADLSRMQGRKDNGELADDLDPGAVLVALMGAITAPIATPQRVQMITGMDPASPEFEEFFGAQLRRMVRYLAGCRHDHGDSDGAGGDSRHEPAAGAEKAPRRR